MENANEIIVFEQNKIRRVAHEGEIWFSIVDIIEVLTDSPIARTYWSKIKAKIKALKIAKFCLLKKKVK